MHDLPELPLSRLLVETLLQVKMPLVSLAWWVWGVEREGGEEGAMKPSFISWGASSRGLFALLCGACCIMTLAVPVNTTQPPSLRFFRTRYLTVSSGGASLAAAYATRKGRRCTCQLGKRQFSCGGPGMRQLSRGTT